MMARESRSPVSGRQLILILTGIALVTVVVPPAMAWRLNHQRVEQTRERASLAAERVRNRLEPVAKLAGDARVACGPGRMPKPSGAAEQDAWLLKAVVAPGVFGDAMPTDAWGQCFLMNVREEASGGRVWILSAGPNGLIDTPFGANVLAGDDIGAVVK